MSQNEAWEAIAESAGVALWRNRDTLVLDLRLD